MTKFLYLCDRSHEPHQPWDDKQGNKQPITQTSDLQWLLRHWISVHSERTKCVQLGQLFHLGKTLYAIGMQVQTAELRELSKILNSQPNFLLQSEHGTDKGALRRTYAFVDACELVEARVNPLDFGCGPDMLRQCRAQAH